MLMGGQRRPRQTSPTRQQWREIGLFVWALIATIVIVVLAVVVQHEQSLAHSHRERSGVCGKDGKPT